MVILGLRNLKIFHGFIILFFVFGLLFPTGGVVIAQDIPPAAVTEEPQDEAEPPVEEPAAEPPAEPPTEEPTAEDVTAEPPTEEPTAEPPAEITPVVDETMVPTEAVDPSVETPAGPAENATEPAAEPTTEPTAEAPDETPAEIIIAAVEADVTLVDEEGTPLVMADEETSELLETGDPYFIRDYGTGHYRGLTWVWDSLPVYEAWGRGSCISSNSSRTVVCHSDSANPIQDAINAAPSDRVVHIAAGDYTADNLIITKEVRFRTEADIVVNSITLNPGANVSFHAGGNLRTGTWETFLGDFAYNQNFTASMSLTSANIFLNEGARLSDAIELAANGGAIEISAGTFDEETSIDVTKSVDIGGQGASTILSPSGINAFGALLVIQADNVTIHDLTLDGNGNILTTTGIRDTADFDGLEVYNTTIGDFLVNGVQVNGNSTFNIHDNTIQNMRGVDMINYASGIRVENDRGAVSGQLVTNNLFTNNDNGLFVQDSRLQVRGNNFTGNTRGFHINDLDAGDSVQLQFNRFFGNTTAGLSYTTSGDRNPIVTSNQDWWGCNGGPGAEGCDTVSGTRLTVPIHLKFALSASPTSLSTGNTSTLASYMYEWNNPRNVVNNANIPWFTSPLPTMTGTSNGTLDGNVFTAGGMTGVQNFSAIFDNATATTSVEVTGDVDGDGISNEDDNCVNDANPDQADADGDGEGDVCDITPNGDNDEDGIDNLDDNCVDTYNPDQSDLDGDGEGDVCDATPNGDWDEDGIDDLTDNCPETWNPDQLDSDDDGQGDACDATPFGDPFDPPGGGDGPFAAVGGLPGLIPVTGGLITLSCFEAATLSLPSGDNIVFSDPLCDFEAAFSQESLDSLPGPIPDGYKFVSAVNLLIQKSGFKFNVLPEPVTFTLTFVVPDEYIGKTLQLLTWDTTLNDGLGGWASTLVVVTEDGQAVIPNLNFTGLFVLLSGG